MSSGSNSGSEDEDAYDLLARIKSQMNKDDDDSEEDEDENDDKKVQQQNKESDKDSQEENSDDDISKKINSEVINNQNLSANEQDQGQLNEKSQKDQNKQKINNNNDDHDEEEEDSRFNINNILQQNGIDVEKPDETLKQQQKSLSEQQKQEQQAQTNEQTQLVNQQASQQKSPSRIQKNSESGQISPIKNDDQQKKKENIFTVVRTEAEKKEDQLDHLLLDMENIKIKRALLEDPEIMNFKIDSSSLEQTIEQVKKKYDENVGKYMVKQVNYLVLFNSNNKLKRIFEKIKEINKRSSVVYDSVNTSNKNFLKKKISDKEKYVKEIQKLQNDSSKTKTFLLMMIQRLEAIEHDIDKFTDTKLKEINKRNQEQAQKQELNNNIQAPQENNQVQQ